MTNTTKQNTNPDNDQLVDDKDVTQNTNTSDEKSGSKKAKPNAAIVYNGSREVRRYTKEAHGSKFEKLAEMYAEKRGYTVELKNVEPGIICPSCGYEIHQ